MPTQTEERSGPAHVEPLERVVIRFAGDSGDGMQITGSQFTSSTAATTSTNKRMNLPKRLALVQLLGEQRHRSLFLPAVCFQRLSASSRKHRHRAGAARQGDAAAWLRSGDHERSWLPGCPSAPLSPSALRPPGSPGVRV